MDHLARADGRGKARVGRVLRKGAASSQRQQIYCVVARDWGRFVCLCNATKWRGICPQTKQALHAESPLMKGLFSTRAVGEDSCLRCGIGVLFVNGLLLPLIREKRPDSSPVGDDAGGPGRTAPICRTLWRRGTRDRFRPTLVGPGIAYGCPDPGSGRGCGGYEEW